jgi:hypothetical protein
MDIVRVGLFVGRADVEKLPGIRVVAQRGVVLRAVEVQRRLFDIEAVAVPGRGLYESSA